MSEPGAVSRRPGPHPRRVCRLPAFYQNKCSCQDLLRGAEGRVPTTLGGFFDAVYRVKNLGGAPFAVQQLYTAVRPPQGHIADLVGDGNSNPILPDEEREIYKAVSAFNCSGCVTDTYEAFASNQLPNSGGWWERPPATGTATNATAFTVTN